MTESAMALLVRRAEVADAAAIASSHVRSWQSGYASVISDDFLKSLGADLPRRTLGWQTQILGAEAEGRFLLVAELDGEVAGWLGGGAYRDTDLDDPPLGEVYACYIDPEHWRKGVGSALMADALDRLIRDGYTQAALWVLADNLRARAFYEHLGWRLDGAHKIFEVADERHQEVRYRRLLP
ncbi:MAG: GNAT family N-acetyltransferase [Acidimicrobiales bacterium]|jgi:GNAT superfamily N-acetyltransferase